MSLLSRAYYNEHDPRAAAWLRELIKAGHIAPGDVDERDIQDVRPIDLSGYVQCHFFAGIGVWSYALRQAGWPDSRPVWTGSCPCQPFSAAGKGDGFDDERHLWPSWHWLIEQCRPGVIFGEQVASKGGLAWLDRIQADLEGAGYAGGALDLCAAGIGAPHIRQRLFFVAERLAHANGSGLEVISFEQARAERRQAAERDCETCRLAHSDSDKPKPGRSRETAGPGRERWDESEHGRIAGGLEHPSSIGRQRREAAGPTNGFWRHVDWLGCRDGKWRPVEPGTFPLVNGAAERVGLLRGYGNAIVAPLAQAFIEAYREIRC